MRERRGRLPPRDPRARRVLGRLARRGGVEAAAHRLARRRAHDGHLVPGHGRRLHRGQQAGLGARRAHPPLPWRQLGGRRRRPRRQPDEDDDLAARRGARHALRRRLHGTLLRLLRAQAGPLGARAAAADLREGPARPGRSLGVGEPRPRRARRLPRGLPPPCLPADPGRLRRQARHAGTRGHRGGTALRARSPLARRAARRTEPHDAVVRPLPLHARLGRGRSAPLLRAARSVPGDAHAGRRRARPSRAAST